MSKMVDESGQSSGFDRSPAPATPLVAMVTDLTDQELEDLRKLIDNAPPGKLEVMQAPQTPLQDPALIGIAEMMEESGGHWRPCSGCYDTEDGHPTQKYDFSPALRTSIGCGCTECGGIGATWEHYTAEEVEQMVRGEIDDAVEILSRLADGDTIVFSQDGDYAWFTKGDRAFVGDTIMELRKNGFLKRQCDDEENHRGMSEYDTISDAGRAHLAALATEADHA